MKKHRSISKKTKNKHNEYRAKLATKRAEEIFEKEKRKEEELKKLRENSIKMEKEKVRAIEEQERLRREQELGNRALT